MPKNPFYPSPHNCCNPFLPCTQLKPTELAQTSEPTVHQCNHPSVTHYNPGATCYDSTVGSDPYSHPRTNFSVGLRVALLKRVQGSPSSKRTWGTHNLLWAPGSLQRQRRDFISSLSIPLYSGLLFSSAEWLVRACLRAFLFFFYSKNNTA